MSEPFLAEIRIVGFNFAPRGWAFCDGQILPINQNQSLYSLLGTVYGGDGRTSFALPDLRGRTPIHPGNGWTQGRKSGEETNTLSAAEMPAHDHQARASSADGDQIIPNTNVYAGSVNQIYHEPNNLVATNSAAIASVGGGQGHDTMQPFLAVNFCIALQGLFPSRT